MKIYCSNQQTFVAKQHVVVYSQHCYIIKGFFLYFCSPQFLPENLPPTFVLQPDVTIDYRQ